MAAGSGERWQLRHCPGLDGLRGIAIALVVVFHVAQRHGPNALGTVGVTAFFTLSGFLITALLLKEHISTGRIAWGRFYVRRARRLFPALVVVIPVAVAFNDVSHLMPTAQVWPVVAYFGNWTVAFGGNLGLMGHAWSLAVEEQFYLIWPLALWIALRWRRGPLLVVVIGITTSCLLRIVLWDGGAGTFRIFFGSDTRADGLLVGCLLAITLHHGARLPRITAWWAGVLVLVGMTFAAFAGGGVSVNIIAPTVTPWVTAVLIVAALGAEKSWMSNEPLCWLGRRSYGLYLWHYPVMASVWFATGSLFAMAASVPVVLLIAEASWRLVEEPFLRRRSLAVVLHGDREPRITVCRDRGRAAASP